MKKDATVIQFPTQKKEDTTMTTTKMKNIALFESIQTIQQTDEKGKLGYALAKNLRTATDAAQEYLIERDKALMEFGEDQGNGQFRIPKEALPAFRERMAQFDDIETEFPVHTVSEELFCSGNLTTRQMYTLAWMVEEAKEE